MASVQGNYGIPGYGDVKVTFGRQVENAKHVGLGESKARVAAKNEPAAEPAAPAQAAAPPPLPEGVRVFSQPDGDEVWASQSGVKIRVDKQGDISNLEILGEGKMTKGPDGQFKMTGADGQPRPVSEFESPEGKVLGYTYEKADKTQVYVYIDEMVVAYHSADKTVMQEVDASGGHLIHSVRDFQHANGRKEKLETRVYVSPQGEVESDGYTAGLEMHPGKMKFISPRNFPMEVDFVKPLANLANYEMPAAKTAAAQPQAAPANAAAPTPGPVQTPPNPPANAPLPQIHGTDVEVELPSQVYFKRDQTGQTSIQLRNGLTMVYRDGTAAAIEVATGTPLSVSTEDYQSRDGRREKTFLFKDTNGNAYRMFQQSQDFIVQSADQKVLQHVLPNGAILGQVAADNGRLYKFEVGPRGNYVTDPGLDFQQKSGDKDVIFVPGADGQPVPMKLPYGIPENQSNAGMNADIHGTQRFPLSGQVLSAFQANNNQPQAAPQQGQFQGAGAPPPGAPPHPGGPQGGPPPLPPEMDPSIFPRPGMPQQSVSPSFMQRLKFFFSGNPNDLNVVPPQIPPDMRSMPRGHFATGPNGNSTPPFDMSGNQVGHGLGPGAPRQNAGPNYADASGGQQQTWGGQMPDGSHAPMPGTPNYYGSLNTNPMIANFQREFEFQQQAMMRQLRWGQYTTLALTGVTAISSIASMFSYTSLMPSGLFVNPMSMLG